MTKDDYVHLLKEACGGRCNAEFNPCAFRQAADELDKLQPVGVFAYDSENKIWEELIKGYNGTALFALDGGGQ
jgi:hypothetical protein